MAAVFAKYRRRGYLANRLRRLFETHAKTTSTDRNQSHILQAMLLIALTYSWSIRIPKQLQHVIDGTVR